MHVVGPDLRSSPLGRLAVWPLGRGGHTDSWAAAVGALSLAYENALHEFERSGRRGLRLLPISGGIFAGEFAGRVPELTRAALDAALCRLPPPLREELLGERRLEMCVFSESEWDGFLAAGFAPCGEAAAADIGG